MANSYLALNLTRGDRLMQRGYLVSEEGTGKKYLYVPDADIRVTADPGSLVVNALRTRNKLDWLHFAHDFFVEVEVPECVVAFAEKKADQKAHVAHGLTEERVALAILELIAKAEGQE